MDGTRGQSNNLGWQQQHECIGTVELGKALHLQHKPTGAEPMERTKDSVAASSQQSPEQVDAEAPATASARNPPHRSVSFAPGDVTEVIQIPRYESDELRSLFYNKYEIERFQEEGALAGASSNTLALRIQKDGKVNGKGGFLRAVRTGLLSQNFRRYAWRRQGLLRANVKAILALCCYLWFFKEKASNWLIIFAFLSMACRGVETLL
mmetsp:Transcript_36913/g.68403  ORF Transcript_36913/g.68403 Transcript_36913/m.68403 type:complete len:208 (-) Transcript_36913:153-776(-)